MASPEAKNRLLMMRKFIVHFCFFSAALTQLANGQLLVNKGSTATITPGCLVVVKNASIDNNIGVIDNAGDFYIDIDVINSGTLTGGGANGNYFVGGNWINNGTFTADQSLVELNGAAQQISGTNPTTFYNLTLSGSGVKTQTIDASVTNTLNLGNLELATGTNKMFVTNSAINAIQLGTGFVSSLGNGRLSRTMNASAAYLFPVGSSVGTLRYRPIEITPPSTAAHTFEVRMANVDATTENYDRSIRDTTICDVNANFYHLINRTTGTGSVAVNFFYIPSLDGLFPKNAHWQNLPQWEDMGIVTNGTSGLFTTQSSTWSNFTLPAFALAKPATIVTLSGLNTNYCTNDAAVAIITSPVGGILSGPGVQANQFNPSTAGVGTHTISYTYLDAATQCTQTKTRIVTVSASPQISVTPSGPTSFCSGQNVTLTASGASSYSWSDGSISSSISVVNSGSYSVTGTSNGCSATSNVVNVNVTSAQPPTILSSSGSNSICNNTPVTLSGSTAQSYLWSNGQTTQNITVTSAGTYTLTVNYSNGCTSSSSFTLQDGVAPTPQIVADGSLTFCAGENVILTTVEPYVSYQWNGYNSTLPFANIINSGSYSVTVTGADGCSGTSNSILVNVLPLPNPTVTPNGSVNICAGDNTTISTQSGFVSYEWFPNGGTSVSATVNQSGYYYAVVTDENGCSNYSDSVHVIVQNLPNPITIAANGPVNFCEGNSVVLSAPAGFQSYSWTPNGQETQNIVVTQSGTYTCTVTNQYGCSPSSNSNAIVVNVFEGIPPVIGYNADTLTSTPGVSYQWYLNGSQVFGATNQNFIASKSGVYYVVITDENGCILQSNTLEYTYVPNTGLTENFGIDNIQLFPNPSENELTLQIEFYKPTEFNLSFTDMIGKSILKKESISMTSNYIKTFDVSELASGVYFVVLTSDSKSAVFKFNKQ